MFHRHLNFKYGADLDTEQVDDEPKQAKVFWQDEEHILHDPTKLCGKQISKKGPTGRHPLKNCLRAAVREAIARKFDPKKTTSEQTDAAKENAWTYFLQSTCIGRPINDAWPLIFTFQWFLNECKTNDKKFTRGRKRQSTDSPRSSAKKSKKKNTRELAMEAEIAALKKQLAETIGKPDSETPALAKMLKDGEEQKNKITTYQKQPPTFES